MEAQVCFLESFQCRGKAWGGTNRFHRSMSGCTADVIDKNLSFMSIRPTLGSRNCETEVVKELCKKGHSSLVRQQVEHERHALAVKKTTAS